jgi:hypothetical protein
MTTKKTATAKVVPPTPDEFGARAGTHKAEAEKILVKRALAAKGLLARLNGRPVDPTAAFELCDKRFADPIGVDGEAVPPIAASRRRLGITLRELAHAAAIDPAHLELMERRSLLASPTLAELERIADALHLDVEEIR